MTQCLVGTPDPEGREPTLFELWVLERERPVLEAELAVVEAECAYLARPSELARGRVRQAERRLGRLCSALDRSMPARVIALDERIETGSETDAAGLDGESKTKDPNVEGVA